MVKPPKQGQFPRLPTRFALSSLRFDPCKTKVHRTLCPTHFVPFGHSVVGAFARLRNCFRTSSRSLPPSSCVQASRFALIHALRALRALSRGRVRISPLYASKLAPATQCSLSLHARTATVAKQLWRFHTNTFIFVSTIKGLF